jgi:hypothetical protein
MHIQDAVKTLSSMVLVIRLAFPVPLIFAACPLSSSIRGKSWPTESIPPASSSSVRPGDHHTVNTVFTIHGVQLCTCLMYLYVLLC